MSKEEILERIAEGYVLLNKFLKYVDETSPYWWKPVKLNDIILDSDISRRLKIGRLNLQHYVSNQWLYQWKELKKSLKEQMYFPLVNIHSPTGPTYKIFAGKHRLEAIKEMTGSGSMDGNLKVPLVYINKKVWHKKPVWLEIPCPIKIYIPGISHLLEGYEIENVEKYDPETKKSYVKITNGEYCYTVIRLITQRTSYYILYLKQHFGTTYQTPELMKYKLS